MRVTTTVHNIALALLLLQLAVTCRGAAGSGGSQPTNQQQAPPPELVMLGDGARSTEEALAQMTMGLHALGALSTGEWLQRWYRVALGIDGLRAAA